MMNGNSLPHMPQGPQEFDWSGEDEKRHAREVRRTEIMGIALFTILVVGLGAVFIPFNQLFLTEEEMQEMYTPSFEWINRCDEQCILNCNPRFLDTITSCATLAKEYQIERQNYNVDWRIAIDDRASFLGCEGFPKDMDTILADGQAAVAAIEARQRKIREEKEALQREQESQQSDRFRQSLIDGSIRKYTLKFQQDPSDQDTMIIVVSNTWLRESQFLRRQIAEVFWQKWANIRNPLNTDSVRIRLLNSDNEEVGGSPQLSALPIWVTTGSLLPGQNRAR